MTPTREDLELYVTGNYDGDVDALERAIAEDPALAAIVAEEAKLEHAAARCRGGRDVLPRHATRSCAASAAMRAARRCGPAATPSSACWCRTRTAGCTSRTMPTASRSRSRSSRSCRRRRPPRIAAFEREAKFLRALEHPAIPRFCASFEEGNGVHARYYLAQELVDGHSRSIGSTTTGTARPRSSTSRARCSRSSSICRSLSPMVIHRDIKPANLVQRSDGIDRARRLRRRARARHDRRLDDDRHVRLHAGRAARRHRRRDDRLLRARRVAAPPAHAPGAVAARADQDHGRTCRAPLRAFLDKLIATDPRDRFASAKDALVALDTKEALVIVPKEPRARWRYAVAAAGLLAVGGGMFALTHTHEEERDANMVQAGAASFGTIRMRLPDGVAKVIVDGQEHHAKSGDVIQLVPGKHHVRVNLGNGLACDDPAVDVKAGSETVLDCYVTAADVKPALAPDDDPPRLRSDNKVSWKFNKSPFHDVMRLASTTCGFNVVVPDHIQPKITINLNDVPCDQALEVLLEAQGLWYVYTPDAKLVRIGTRKDIDDEPDDEPSRLPAGKGVDVDIKLAPLRDVLAMIASGEKVNLVVPDSIGGNVTIRAVNVPWHQLFEATLAAHKLGYRYRENGKIIVIAPLDEDDRQNDAVAPRQYSIDPPPGTGKLEVRMSPDRVAKIVIDGRVSIVKDKQVFELAAGAHTIKIIGQKKTCEHQVVIEKGESGVLVCPL